MKRKCPPIKANKKINSESFNSGGHFLDKMKDKKYKKGVRK